MTRLPGAALPALLALEALIASPTVLAEEGPSLEARARLIDTLQRGRTSDQDERAIRDLFLATKGVALTRLKNLVDQGADHRDLHQLIHHDIDDAEIRIAILAHIASEAARVPVQGTKLTSDIDDTVYANWKDRRYPKKTIYPGVRQLYLELDEDPAKDGSGPIVTFLTARPAERSGEIEQDGLAGLEERGFDRAIMLSGSITHLSNGAIAKKKHENFLRYADLFPEYRFVFVGDSGQGDAELAIAMRSARPSAIRGLFIHVVDEVSDAERTELERHDIHLFDTYAGAAADAYEDGLMDAAALLRVAKATRREMKRVPFETKAQRETMRALLERDLTRIESLIAARPKTP